MKVSRLRSKESSNKGGFVRRWPQDRRDIVFGFPGGIQGVVPYLPQWRARWLGAAPSSTATLSRRGISRKPSESTLRAGKVVEVPRKTQVGRFPLKAYSGSFKPGGRGGAGRDGRPFRFRRPRENEGCGMGNVRFGPGVGGGTGANYAFSAAVSGGSAGNGFVGLSEPLHPSIIAPYLSVKPIGPRQGRITGTSREFLRPRTHSRRALGPCGVMTTRARTTPSIGSTARTVDGAWAGSADPGKCR